MEVAAVVEVAAAVEVVAAVEVLTAEMELFSDRIAVDNMRNVIRVVPGG